MNASRRNKLDHLDFRSFSGAPHCGAHTIHLYAQEKFANCREQLGERVISLGIKESKRERKMEENEKLQDIKMERKLSRWAGNWNRKRKR
jgi:hypothetical protein